MKGKKLLNLLLIPLAVILLVLAIWVVMLLMLKNQVGSYRGYWQQQAKGQVTGDTVMYIALGDSAAQGIGASKPERGYVGLLAASLAEKYEADVRTVNLSVTGAKIKDVLDKQLPQLQKITMPENTVVTLEIGANDLGSFNSQTFKTDIDKLFSRLPKQTVVADLPFFGGGRYRNREPMAVQGSEIVRTAAKRHGLKVAPLHEITKSKDSLRVYAWDYFHPSDRGHQNWHDAFWHILSTSPAQQTEQ